MTSAAFPRAGGPSRKTVLVVDDDHDARNLLTSVLESAEYDVLQAGDGAEALRVLAGRGVQCSIILLDLMMPVMNGWDFRRKQRENADLAGIPVLLMSAGAHIAAASGDMGAVGYMAKPVEVADLLAQVKKHCA
jgi:CheY-like chemotaxis protein